MTIRGVYCGIRLPSARLRRRLGQVVLASVLLAGCEYPFEPYEDIEGAVFSMYGYLDLKADTQWVRVMPIRQSLLLDAEPIDAVVTLEHEGSGRTVTLRDSLFSFRDSQVDGVAYAHNFWTTEPLEPGATYRLTAVRSDGASTTATVVMPAHIEIAYLIGPGLGTGSVLLRVRSENVLFTEILHAMSDTGGNRRQTVVVPQDDAYSTGDAGIRTISLRNEPVDVEGLRDVGRMEIRLAVGRADWPFDPDLPDVVVDVPGQAPSNVENGLGYVAGVATWTIPFHACVPLRVLPNSATYCTTVMDGESASIAGRLIHEACGDPAELVPVHLIERFADGTTFMRSWLSGWDGEYRFEGIEPGSELSLDVGLPSGPVPLPQPAESERYLVDDIAVPRSC